MIHTTIAWSLRLSLYRLKSLNLLNTYFSFLLLDLTQGCCANELLKSTGKSTNENDTDDSGIYLELNHMLNHIVCIR